MPSAYSRLMALSVCEPERVVRGTGLTAAQLLESDAPVTVQVLACMRNASALLGRAALTRAGGKPWRRRSRSIATGEPSLHIGTREEPEHRIKQRPIARSETRDRRPWTHAG